MASATTHRGETERIFIAVFNPPKTDPDGKELPQSDVAGAIVGVGHALLAIQDQLIRIENRIASKSITGH